MPVWFLWRDGTAMIMSEPHTVKVANVRHDSPALLHRHTDETGNNVVILSGTATISERDSAQWLPEIGDAYTAKYAEGMRRFGSGLDEIAAQYSTVIVLTPTHLDAW